MTHTILFVDDEKACHIWFKLICEEEASNVQIISAYTGNEAIQISQANPNKIDIIFTDFLLPDMDGYQFYNTLKEDLNFATTPFIFQTGLDIKATNIMRHKNDLAMINVISKPYDSEELINIINHHLYKIPIPQYTKLGKSF